MNELIIKNKCSGIITSFTAVLHIVNGYECLNVFKVTRSIANCLYTVFVSSPHHSGAKDNHVTAYLRSDVNDKQTGR